MDRVEGRARDDDDDDDDEKTQSKNKRKESVPIRMYEVRGTVMIEEGFGQKVHSRKYTSYGCVMWSRQ